MVAEERFYPHRAPIDAYGNGGFRFAEMSHRGSLMVLSSGMRAWEASDIGGLDVESFLPVLNDRDAIEICLLGAGPKLQFPDSIIREAFDAAGVGLEVMDTGAACRTYNVLLAEQRAVAAALIAVE